MRLMAVLIMGTWFLAGCGSRAPEAITTTTVDPKSMPAVTVPLEVSRTTEDRDAGRGDVTDLDLEAAVEAYTKSILTGDGDAAYALLSDRCHADLPRNDFTEMADSLSAEYGTQSIQSYEVKQDGNLATVTYRFDDPAIDQTNERWVREGGAWHSDEC